MTSVSQYKVLTPNLLACLSVLALAGALCGCQSSKGLGRDVKESSVTLGEKIKNADAWMTEHMW